MHDLNSDIEKYLKGELTPAEMHALEKKALNDPFLAEALEGGGEIEADDFAADMQQLHASLNARLAEKKGKVISLWGWTVRIAAGLLLIVISTFIIVNLTDDNADLKKEQLAENKQESSLPSPAAADSAVESSAGIAAQDQKVKTDTAPLRDRNYITQAERVVAPKIEKQKQQELTAPVETSTYGYSTSKAGEADIKSEETEQLRKDIFGDSLVAVGDLSLDTTKNQLAGAVPGVAVNPQTRVVVRGYTTQSADATDDEDAADKRESKKAKRKAEAKDITLRSASEVAKEGVIANNVVANKPATNESSIVRGRITSAEDGSGLPAVNVLIKGTEKGTITDADGNYEIVLDNSSATLVYSFIGLESTERTVAANTTADVVLNEDVSQLSEVVVTGYGEGEVDEGEYATFEMAAPAGGRKAFKKYLEEKIVYPQVALDNKIEGKVTIQFNVDTFGKLSDFRVVKGLGYGCDEEVIRLIREGPAWSPMKRNEEPIRGRVRVRMRFALPDKKK